MTLDISLLLDLSRLLVGILILTYASISDIKTRRASNLLWIIMGTIGGILLIIQYLTIGFDNLIQLIFIPIMIALMYVLFQLRLLFGGADAKAVMALAILVPIQPTIIGLPLWGNSFMPYSWVIFSNALILFLCIPLSLLIYNIFKKDTEFPHCILGYKMKIEKAKQSFVWPLEKIKDGKRKFSYMPKNNNVDSQLKIFEKQGIKEIWVTPKVPFMIPLLASFLVSFFLGDILINIIQSFN
jgi:preflagellin peptidase FlaK